MALTMLVKAGELRDHPQWRIFDCSHDLANPGAGRERYAAGHIPGAVHAHLDEDLSGPRTGRNGRHPLPSPDAFAQWLGRQGVEPHDVVVAYDDNNGMFAARLWWMLRWIGHARALVLDGGLAAWRALSAPVETATPAFEPKPYTGRADAALWVSASDVEDNLREPRFQLLDARARNRFAGRDETIDPVGGHIPHALNRPFTDNIDASGLFKDPATLREEYAALLGPAEPAQVVHQCGSGVTACHNLLAMSLAGLDGSRLYPGSWSEWCSDPARPVAVGES